MKSRWSEDGARDALARWAGGADEDARDLALRVYTSRLIGADPELVLHGGGNTSVKLRARTLLGETLPVIHVKGSGVSLDAVGPRDLPALELEPLRRLRALEELDDEAMVNQLRTRLLDASSPNPSVETLLHAFLPQRFVDHSHADAVLAATNQPDGEALVREALGDRVAVLPWIMPGFPLAKAVAEAVEKHPDVEGVVLVNHGLFSFGEDARTSYERHVALVDACERLLAERARGRTLLTPRAAVDESDADELHRRVALAAPILRGLLAEPPAQEGELPARGVLAWLGDPETRAFCASEEAAALAREGPLTPDHVIRTKALPLFVAEPDWKDPERLRGQLGQAVADYRADYDRYFAENAARQDAPLTKLASGPRVVWLPGLGALCFGATDRAARVAADITRHTLRAKALAQAVGSYRALPLSELFEMEYWSLEQAKLGKAKPRPLEGQVVLVTGGAGAIGVGIAEVCAAAGAHVALADLDGDAARERAEAVAARQGPGSAVGIAMDVRDEASVRRGFGALCAAWGGLDVLVPNAGLAHVAPIEELDLEEARRLADVNYLGVLLAIREATRIFRLQGTGGNVVVNASKNVFAPGRDFAAYSASKAAAHQLAKVAALELAPLGVRVNQVNADAIFAEGEVHSGLWETVGPERARRRGLEPEELPDFYRDRNLLKARVSARHVGNAVVFFASEQTPTTGATLPVDGGIPEAFPR